MWPFTNSANQYNYAGTLKNGQMGYSTDTTAFKPGGITAAWQGKAPGQGYTGADFMDGFGLNSLIGLGSAFMNYNLGKDQLAQGREMLDFQKDAWNKKFAMMQDQYYRKLNNRRAYRAIGPNTTSEELNNIGNYYDSGANLEGPYNPSGMNNGATGPTVQNQQMMDQATGGAPYSPAAAQGMMQSSQFATPPMAGSDAAVNPANVVGGDGGYAAVRRDQRRRKKPETQSTNDTGSGQTTSEKIG